MNTVYLLLGSNLGDRERYLSLARDMIGELPDCRICGSSSISESEAVAMSSIAGPFLNQVVCCEVESRPLEFLKNLEEIESNLGRKNKGQKLPRTIDIDILLYGEFVIDSQRLTVPHAALTERIFALEPLLELDPELVDPRNSKGYASVLSELMRKQVKPHIQHVPEN